MQPNRLAVSFKEANDTCRALSARWLPFLQLAHNRLIFEQKKVKRASVVCVTTKCVQVIVHY